MVAVRLLVAEDDSALREVLCRGLVNAGYVVDSTGQGDDALELLVSNDYAAAIIDWRMPGMDGAEAITEARHRGSSTPILMLTARDTLSDRITGLDAGSDDYLVKPFDFDELLARLRALTRRSAGPRGPALRVGALELDPTTRALTLSGEEVALTPTEFAIVELLIRDSPGVVTRQRIAHHVWPDALDPLGSNTIDSHVARLRAKLSRGGVAILAVRSAGYRLAVR